MGPTVCRRAATLLCAAALAVLAAACGSGDAGAPGTESPSPAVPADPLPTAPTGATETEMTLRGRLGGDPQLEGGCAWVESGRQRYEVLWPQGYEVRFQPLRLLGPDGGVVAREGDIVAVSGAPAEGAFSICQIGPIWQATGVTAP